MLGLARRRRVARRHAAEPDHRRAAIIGLPLALWRSVVAHRQTETARLGLANDKYQNGAEMLGDKRRYVRLGGVYGLQHLAPEHPERYHLETLRIFCSFLRDQVPLDDDRDGSDGTAVLEMLRALGNPTARQIEVEAAANFWINLSRLDLSRVKWAELDIPNDRLNFSRVLFAGSKLSQAELPRAYLFQARLSDADFTRADLPGAMLDSCSARGTVFRNASLSGANLDHAWLPGADLTEAGLANATLRWADLTGACLIGAYLRSADLSGANLSNCRGLTQAQLDLALARRDRAPTLTDALDNDTREPLISRGKVHDGCNHQRGRPGVEHRVPLDSEHRFPTSAPGNVRQRRRGRIR